MTWPAGLRRAIATSPWNDRKAFPGWLVLLLAAVTLAVAVRSHRLGWQVLSNDEAFSWRLTRYQTPDLLAHAAEDVHPPLYYVVLQAWLGLWDTSPAAMRGLSAVLGALCVGMIYVVSLEACHGGGNRWGPAGSVARAGALLAAFLAAVHVSQVTPGRTARMYVLGVFLGGLTAWLLLRALRAQRGGELWWTAYGLAAAAFCYTHYYAFFTIAAQAAFAAGDLLVRGCKGSVREAVGSGLGFLWASVLAGVLYSPWLPVLGEQTRQVRQGFWVTAVTVKEAERVFFSWSTGLEYPRAAESHLWVVSLGAVVVWIMARGGRAGWFFLLQAGLPWLLSLGLSAYSGRSIFLEYCLAFGQLSLLGFWAVVWCCLPGLAVRFVLAATLGTTSLLGLWSAAEDWPSRPAALAAAAGYLKEHYRVGDMILADSPPAVNRLRYYLGRAGVTPVNVRCTVRQLPGEGHRMHVASLDADDILWSDRDIELEKAHRIWRASEHDTTGPPFGERWKEVRRHTFDGGGNKRWTLLLYQR
jgi:hypothetical protein